MAELVVIIPTFNRPEILHETVAKLVQNLIPKPIILIGDDGNYEETSHWFAREAGERLGEPLATVLKGPRNGLGANLNMLLKEAERISPIALQMDDDHLLTDRLDVSQHIKTLVDPDYSEPRIGWIRLFMGEAKDYNNWQTYYKFTARSAGPYWIVYPNRGELYIPSNRPHLKLIAMHRDYYGWYPEGRKLGETETTFCHQFAAQHRFMASPEVAVPMFLQDCWKHIGDSWQGTKYDK